MAYLTQELIAQVHARIEECFVIAEERYGREFPRVRIKFNKRLTSCAGRARSRGGIPVEMDFSVSICALNPEEFVARTPGHEVAHIIDTYLHGSSSHGRNWQSIMRLFGQDPSRCHSMETIKRSPQNRVVAHCGCTEHQITKQRAGKMRNGTGSYKCNSCKVVLKLGRKPAESPVESMCADTRAQAIAESKVAAKRMAQDMDTDRQRDLDRAEVRRRLAAGESGR